jgi:hypothetical protein
VPCDDVILGQDDLDRFARAFKTENYRDPSSSFHCHVAFGHDNARILGSIATQQEEFPDWVADRPKGEGNTTLETMKLMCNTVNIWYRQ